MRSLGREPGPPQVPPQVPGHDERRRDEDQPRDPQDPAAVALPAACLLTSGYGAVVDDLGLGHPLKCRRFGRFLERRTGADGLRPFGRRPSEVPYNQCRGRALVPRRCPESGAGRGGPAHRGSRADRGRRRVGQDPGAHAPDRVPDPGARREPLRDPRDHVHEQGGPRDGGAGGGAARAAHREGDVDPHVPFGVRADPAARARPPRAARELHDLRRRGHRAPAHERPEGPEPGSQAVPAPGDVRGDRQGEGQRPVGRRVRADGRATSTSRRSRTCTWSTRSASSPPARSTSTT